MTHNRVWMGSKDDHSEGALEEFWLEIAENSIDYSVADWRGIDFYDRPYSKKNKNDITILQRL